MNYFEWLGELDAVKIGFPDRQFNGYWMVEGEPVIGWNDKMIAVYDSAETPVFDFGLALDAWPLFSPKMRFLIDKLAPGQIQHLPFRFQRIDGTGQVTGFSVGQFLKRVDCLDRASTRVRQEWKPINKFGDFATDWPIGVVLNRASIGQQKLFRVQGNSSAIVIREDLKSAIEDAGFKGQRFDPLKCI